MTTREELIDEIYRIGYRVEYGGKESFDMGAVADFILKDRRRICAPLLEKYDIDFTDTSTDNVIKAINLVKDKIDMTLKLSGLDESGEVKI